MFNITLYWFLHYFIDKYCIKHQLYARHIFPPVQENNFKKKVSFSVFQLLDKKKGKRRGDKDMKKDGYGISLNAPKRQQLPKLLRTVSGLDGFKTNKNLSD